MHQALKQHWLAVSRGKPGRRFQDRYAKARKARSNASWSQHMRRLLLVVAALGALFIGMVLMFVPGPAVLFYFLAATLLASESLFLARLLDWTEVKLRALWKWVRPRWKRAPGWVRVVIIGVAIALTLWIAGLAYILFFR